MAYYFKCEECKKKETFALPRYTNSQIVFHDGKKQDYEIIICKSCISKKVRLKGNYIII